MKVSVEALGQGKVAVEALVVLEDLGKGLGQKPKMPKKKTFNVHRMTEVLLRP